MTASLGELRTKIDKIDAKIVELLNDRARLAEEIGEFKLSIGLDAYSPEREAEVMRNVMGENKGPLSAQQMRRLYERIIDESRTIERIYMEQRRREGVDTRR